VTKFINVTKINSNFFSDPFTGYLYCRSFVIRPNFQLFAVRHQSTIINEKYPQRFWQGVSNETDNQLSELSKDQAKKSAKNHYNFLLENYFFNKKELLQEFIAHGQLHILSSPLGRAHDTAEAFTKLIENETNLSLSITINDNTSEQHGGVCENKHYDEVLPKYQAIWEQIRDSNAIVKFPEGESFIDLANRVYHVIDNLNQKLTKNNIVFLFSHNSFINSLRAITGDPSIIESDGKVKFFTKSPYGAMIKIPMYNPLITDDYSQVFFKKYEELKKSRFIIKGGTSLKGIIKSPGSKHAFAGILAAGLLTNKKVILRNVPPILDNYVYAALLRDIGAYVRYDDQLEIMEFQLASISNNHPNDKLVKSIRNSIRLLAPLIGRSDYVKMIYPGGDRIGNRSIEQYLWVLSELGVQIEEDGNYIIARTSQKREIVKEFSLKDPKVTPTVMAMVYAASLGGEIKISNIPIEQEIQDVANFISKIGVSIDVKFGSESVNSFVRIKGKILSDYNNNDSPLEYVIPPDRMYPVTFAVLAGLTNSEIKVVDYRGQDYDGEIDTIKKIGIDVSTCKDNNCNALKFKPTIPSKIDYPLISDFGDISGIEKVKRINTDILPFFAVMASKLNGQELIFKDYTKDNRTHYLKELIKMGACIEIINGSHLFHIIGIENLQPQLDLVGNDLRATVALILAALSTDGISEVSGIEHAYRGYSNLYETLTLLGADISFKCGSLD